MSEIPKTYEPGAIEEKWYAFWQAHGCFTADPASPKPAYSIVIPPPNVTGVLTLGHVLNNTIQDILARRARMTGHEVLWLPGTDHAGIATQTVVERTLKKQGVIKHRDDLGRDAFLEKVWEWKDRHGGIIIQQLKKLGCSCDWSRERFTMDAAYSECVARVFVDLYKKGLIYRGKRMVNWDPVALTALSDEEVNMKPQNGAMFHFKIEVAEQPGTFLTVATTRPETIPGDTAIAVNPKDPRYAHLIGKHAIRPLPVQLPRSQKLIPIIGDDAVEFEFGTGVLKVTPAHDKADFEIAQRHGLPAVDIMNPDGTMNTLAGETLIGLDRFEARAAAVERLRELGALVKEEPYQNNVGFSERTDVPIEPRLSEQWFLKYPSQEQAREVVEQSRAAAAQSRAVAAPSPGGTQDISPGREPGVAAENAASPGGAKDSAAPAGAGAVANANPGLTPGANIGRPFGTTGGASASGAAAGWGTVGGSPASGGAAGEAGGNGGAMRFHPERWAKVYEHWMGNLQDWCISRQLWWGHRVPVWYRRGAAVQEMASEQQEAIAGGQEAGADVREEVTGVRGLPHTPDEIHREELGPVVGGPEMASAELETVADTPETGFGSSGTAPDGLAAGLGELTAGLDGLETAPEAVKVQGQGVKDEGQHTKDLGQDVKGLWQQAKELGQAVKVRGQYVKVLGQHVKEGGQGAKDGLQHEKAHGQDAGHALQAEKAVSSPGGASGNAAGDVEIYCGIEPPQGEGWEQDTDVLDTWFSSWLWPFATMGWPEKTPTLEKFYPTHDLVTGPDIIFFWVARMIMAGFEWMGELPFRNVYFTGIIRDKQGRKMSKSLGNSPDPLDLIARYGADALRFGVMRGAPLGQDILFDEKNVELGRNFCTKLWNACRFRQMHGAFGTFDAGSAGTAAFPVDGEIVPALLASDDKWILLRLDAAIEEITAALEDYRFSDAAQTIYRFFWSEFCDWYLEASKAALGTAMKTTENTEGTEVGAAGGSSAAPAPSPHTPDSVLSALSVVNIPSADARKANALAVIDFVLAHTLRLMHPFLPFITEELWHGLGYSADLPEARGGATLMFAHWPKPLGADFREHYGLDASDEAFANAKYETVNAGRGLRRDFNVASNKRVRFVLKPNAPLAEHEAEVLRLLLNAETLDTGAPALPKGTPAVLTPMGELFLPLEGLIDPAAERERLQKEIAKVEAELGKVRAKLADDNFTAKVPAKVLDEHRDRERTWGEKLTQLTKMREALGD